MEDNFDLPASGIKGASDLIDGIHHQRLKMQFGPDGEATDVSHAAPLPVTAIPLGAVRTRTVYAAGATPIWAPGGQFQVMGYTLTLPTGAAFVSAEASALVVQLRDGADGLVLAEHVLQPDTPGLNTTGWIDLGAGLRSAEPGRVLHVYLSEALQNPGGPRGLHVMVAGADTATSEPAAAGYPYGLPTVGAVTPGTWDGGGGTTVTVTGRNLFEPSADLEGDQGSGYLPNGDGTAFTFTSPITDTKHYATLTVANPFGVTVAPVEITVTGPAVTGYTPDHSPAAGGQTVTLTGTDLQGTSAVIYADDGAEFTDIAVAPDGQSLTATTPEHMPSANRDDRIGFHVTATAGSVRMYNAFLIYAQIPAIVSVTPGSGPPGATIAGQGMYFAAQPYAGRWTLALVGGAGAEYEAEDLTVDTNTSRFTFVVPAAAPSGVYGLRVDCSGGPQTVQEGVELTVEELP